MKLLVGLLLSVGLLLTGYACFSQDQILGHLFPMPPTIPISCDEYMGGDPGPWPWGQEVNFPWTSIEGVWVPVNECNDTAFFIKRIEDSSNKFFVIKYDRYHCDHIKSVGIALEEKQNGGLKNVIKVSMKIGETSDFEFELRAFGGQPEVYLKGPLSPQGSSGAGSSLHDVHIVMTKPQFQGQKPTGYELRKIGASPDLVCYISGAN